MKQNPFIRSLDSLRKEDVPLVGGKNASLGEMLFALKKKGILVPDGFATTADAYREFIAYNELEARIAEQIKKFKAKKISLQETGKSIRKMIAHGKFPPKLAILIKEAYEALGKKSKTKQVDVAVRSSATAEDLPDASFAGQQETYLHIRGIKDLLEACRKCYASLFTDRAITYREAKHFDHMEIALSIGIQKMVRSDKAGAGVMFTIDTESGFKDVIVINASFGLGENVVQGSVNPDEYIVFKPLLTAKKFVPIIEKSLGKKEEMLIYTKGDDVSVKNVPTPLAMQNRFVLTDKEILHLSNWGALIEEHYGMPMDIEWAKDGLSKELYIVQARPETVQSRKEQSAFKSYSMKKPGKKLCSGLAIGEAIVAGKAQVIKSIDQIGEFIEGSILVTKMTSPDWVPIMQKAAGIITDHGGRTSHAAIVSRELALPAIVGTNNATEAIKNGQEITLSCAEGSQGYVYNGILDFEAKEINVKDLPKIKTQLLMNIASPEGAFRWWRLPAQGIGLARMEFIINNSIMIHPMALVHLDKVKNKSEKQKIISLTRGYKDKKEYFIDKLAQGIGRIAAARYPLPVIVRMSDFKTNEYANLIGGEAFEPKEENPMLGFRGASRYYSPRYKEGFALECAAIKRVREVMGLVNVIVMIPFCRTLEEADKVIEVLAENGLKRHEKGLEIYVMAEIPSNIILAEEFADRFDGFSIGSNDLTQLVLGVDRDSEELAPLFDERNPAVKKMIKELITVAKRKKCKVGICGQAPSDHPDFAEFLVRCCIDTISLNPDSIIGTITRLAKIEGESSSKRIPFAI